MLLFDDAHGALRRLADELADRGQFRLPTERALAERLGTSRTTVRRALDLLERDGTIRRVRGRNGGAYLTSVAPRDAAPDEAQSFCHSRSVLRSLNTVKGIPQILHEQGFHDGTTVLRSGLVQGKPETRRALALAADESVVSLLRLRHADGETLSLEQMYLHPDLSAVLRTEMTSIYRTLRSHFGIEICIADESIEIATISDTEGRLLGLPAGTPVLRLERVAYDQHGRVVERSVDLFRADRTRLHVRSQRAATN